MKIAIGILIGTVVLFGCSNEVQPKMNLCKTLECEIINDLFLDAVGKTLYYKPLSAEERSKYLSLRTKEEAQKYFDKVKRIDNRQLVVFYRANFRETESTLTGEKQLRHEFENDILQKLSWSSDSTFHQFPNLMCEVIRPANVKAAEFYKTGKYTLISGERWQTVPKEAKAVLEVSFSRVAFNSDSTKAIFNYEIGCPEGTKCTKGSILAAEKKKGAWVKIWSRLIWQS